MREQKSIALSTLCRLFGVTRQSYSQSLKQKEYSGIREELIIKEVLSIRRNHRLIGTRKLHVMLKDFMFLHNIKLGRDALFDLLSQYQLLIQKKKKVVTTTISRHWLKKYPNLIKEFTPMASNQLYVSDITYWKIKDRHLYISFITDAYSHKIVGHNVAETLEAIECIKALKMALIKVDKGIHLIHHSDRGVQYCSEKYVELLDEYGVRISMTENGDPLENAIAERVNGIIKEEYLTSYQVNNIFEAREVLYRVVNLYNSERPHMSIGNLTPNQIHQSTQSIKPKRLWKNYYHEKGKIFQSPN